MKDFETYIKDQNLDIHLPEEGHIDRFEERLRQSGITATAPPQKTIAFPVWRWAAAAGILLLLGWGLWISIPSPLPDATASLYQENPEFAEMEVYYSSLVNRQLSELEKLDLDQFQFAKQLKQDLDQIEASNEAFRKTILEEGANEYLIDAMIENYKLKLDILKKLSSLIKKSKQRNQKDENHKDI